MADYLISGLVKRRAELAGEADALRARIMQTGVDRYLTDLLTRLVEGWPQVRIDELMPWCWATPQQS